LNKLIDESPKRASEMLAKLSSCCGIVAPALMVALWTLASFLRPGYNQLTQRGSELGTGQAAIGMNVNFAITGVLIIIFALGRSRTIHGSKWSWIGLIFLLICGVGDAITGYFTCVLV